MAPLRYCSALLASAFFFAPADPRARVRQIRHPRTAVAVARTPVPLRSRVLPATRAERRAPTAVGMRRPVPARRRGPPGAPSAWAGRAAPRPRRVARETSRAASSKIAWPARRTPASAVCAATAPSSSSSAPTRPAAPRSWLVPSRADAAASRVIAAISTLLRAPTVRRMGLANPSCSRRRARALLLSSMPAPVPPPTRRLRSRPAPTRGAPARRIVRRDETTRLKPARASVAECLSCFPLPTAMPCQIKP